MISMVVASHAGQTAVSALSTGIAGFELKLQSASKKHCNTLAPKSVHLVTVAGVLLTLSLVVQTFKSRSGSA